MDTPHEVAALDVGADWAEIPVDQMTPEQRIERALLVQYEINRALLTLEQLTAYSAELAGASAEAVDAIIERAENDEFPGDE